MIIQRRHESLAGVHAHTHADEITIIKDEALIARILKAYRLALDLSLDIGDSQWRDYSGYYMAEILPIFRQGDIKAAARILRDPGAGMLYSGFDNSFAATLTDEHLPLYYNATSLDGLARFAEVVGAIRLDNPESYTFRDLVVLEPEALLAGIARKTGWAFTIPNPFPNEHGVGTSRGVLSQRVPQALYQAWRMKKLLKGVSCPRVLEIGAGLGRAAYYARELGIFDYTIVDLPTTCVSQAYFLGRTLGDDCIVLHGESPDAPENRVKIVPPDVFLNGTEHYDLVLNADSMTEMDISVARAYRDKIAASSSVFLSINHEANAFRVTDLIEEHPGYEMISRYPCWMRAGYVEEIARVISPTRPKA